MTTQPHSLIISFTTFIITFFIFFSVVHSAAFFFQNNCPFTVWPASLSGAGSPRLPSTGFMLAPHTKTNALIAPPKWCGRFWGRTNCHTDPSGRFTCATADCASGQVSCNGAGGIPPATLLEVTLGGANNMDFYDVSLVDGFNLPVSISATGRGCRVTGCPRNVNAVCPRPLAVVQGGNVVACKSACLALNQPQFCCTGRFGGSSTCPPTNFFRIFKRQCPQAYSYAYDDKSSTFTCPTGGDYLITFCP